MSEEEPKRLLESLEGGELRSLLEAGKSERPDDRQLLALAAKIGAAGGLGGAGGAAAGTATAAKATAGAAVKVTLAMKIGAAVALASAVGVGAVVVTRPNPGPPPADTHVALVAPPPSIGLSAPPPLVRDPLPSATTSATAKPASTIAPADPEGEVKLLASAQDALRSDPARALALCNEHARKYPGGNVAQEREVIAIEALMKMGNRPAAKARADRFNAAYPGSSHARRIARILGE